MATLFFNEGKNRIGTSGLPATVYFLASTRGVSGAATLHAVTDTLAGGVGEVSGGARKSQAKPSPSAGQYDFTELTFTDSDCGSNAAVRSIVAVDSSDNTGKALCAWDVVNGSGSVITADMSPAGSTLKQTLTVLLQNQGGG